MPVVNHKVYLYKPDGTTFLGELIVDNLKADIKLQDISTVTFRIPEIINGQVNPRVDEVLDSYIIELWYGKVDGVYANGDFEKIRFRIYSTPLEFADYQYLHSYAGYSIESDLEFKQITSWRGIQVKDFFRTITYNKNAGTPRFTETGFTYTISTSSNTSATKYITIDTTDDPTALDIFIYERRTNSGNNSESEVSLIELASGGVNSNDFKAGYYYLNKTGDIVNSVSIALPDNYTSFNGVATANLSYKFYDNPVARAFAIGIKTNTSEPLSNMYIDLAQDAALGDDTPEYGGYTFSSQSIYSKNGLKLNDILTGINNAQDGILYNTGFTVGTISNTIAAKYRSNIDFNNITAYQAIKDIAESFESVAVFNTVDKTVSFYAENEYGSNNGLVIKYATYLKSINKEIDAAKIITNARALGKDNIKISLVNPTGLEVWEDYSYFLDDYKITDTTGFTIIADGTTGLDITYPSTAGFESRWMDAAEAIKVAKWQYTRDYFHYVFSNHNATVVDSSHNGYKGLYLKRSEAINLYVKYETQYDKKKADEYKYFYLLEHYRDLYENKGTNLTEYQYYQNKYNTAVAQAAAFKSTILDAAYENIYDITSVGSLAYKFAEVQSFLDKDTWDIDLDKLRTFQREAVHNDSKVDNEEDLVEATKIYVDENKEPRVTFNISIIDVLEAQEAYQDWDKFVTGDKIYIYFPEFNIDLEAQIREISIDFQSKTLSVVISTVRNYNRSFGNYLTKNIRRFHNANMNTVLYYKDGTDASITQTETVRTTLDTGINAGDTSVNTGATDGSTGESSTTTDGEGQKSRVVTGVDLYTETLTLGAFTTGVKINDGRLLTFKPFDVSGTQWVQEVEVSAENGFVIRRVYGDNTVTKLAYIDATDGSAYFAGWELEPGQFSAGSSSSYVAINSQTPSSGNSLYAFWAGSETASSAPFSVTKAGAVKATAGTIAGLSVGTAYVSTADKSATTNPKNAIFKRSAGGAGVWGENETAFYLDEDGRFSLSNELTWNPATNTFFVNGTIEATIGEIGGWTVAAEKLHAGSTTTYVELNADAASSYAIFAGNTTGATAPFSVTKSGALVASNATITGAITATSGSFTGAITSTSGTIGGWSIGATTLSQNNLTLNSAGTIIVGDSAGDDVAVLSATDATYRLWIGDSTAVDAPFSVDKDGNIKSTAGVIGGWSLNSTRLLKAYDAGLDNDVNIYAGAMPSAITTLGAGGYGFAVENTNPSATEPFIVALTNQGFFVYTDGGTSPVTAMEISYNEKYIWAKGLLISDSKDIANANVSIGTLDITAGAPSNWGLQVNNGTASNGSSVTIDKDGIEIIKTVSDVPTTTFSVDTAGNVAIKGDLTASTGTFGTVATDKGNVLLGGSDPLIVRNNTTEILKLTNAGVLTVSGFTASSSAFFTGIKSTFASNEAGVYLASDGIALGADSPFKVTSAGVLTASSGTVGGWTLNTDAIFTGTKTATGNFTSTAGHVTIGSDGHISAKEFRIDADGNAFFAGDISAATGTFGASIAIGAGDSIFKADSNGIYLGDADFADAEFSVTPAGLLKAVSGTVGGWTLASTTLSGTNVTLDSTGAIAIGSSNNIFKADSNGIYLGNATFASAPFSVTPAGAIKATSGEIGGFTLGSSTLIAGATTTTVGISTGATTSDVAFYAGNATATSAPFRVTNAGALTSTSGSIGGWTINSDGIFTGTFDESGYTTSGITISNNGSIHSENFYLDNTGITTKAGSIGGWTISADNLSSSGLELYSGASPYLSISQATNGYANDGIFLGVDSSQPKFSMVTDSGNTYLKYNPAATYDLEIAGNAKIGPVYVGNDGSNTTDLTSTSGLNYFTGDSVQIVNGAGFGFVTFNLTDRSGQEITGGTVTLSAYSGSNIIASISLYDEINTGGNLLATFDTEDLTTLGGSGGFLFSRNIRNVKRITVSVSSINILSTWTLPIANITVTSYKPSIQINNFTVNSTGELTSSKLTINTSTTVGRDAITILPAIVGTTYKNMVLSTPTGGLTLNRTVRLPDANGTIALNDAAQTFSAIKTFSAEPVFTAGAIFGSAADAANSIEITSTGNIIFEGSSADANEIILTAANATSSDKTITLPDATGTIALMQSSTATMYIGRIWTRSYNNHTWTLRRDATLQVLPTDGTYQVFDLGYLIVDDSANADIIKVEIVGGTSSTSAGRAFVEVVAGTFQTTSGIAVLSYTAFDGVNGNIITPIQYLAQYRTNGNNFEVRRPTSIRMSGGA